MTPKFCFGTQGMVHPVPVVRRQRHRPLHDQQHRGFPGARVEAGRWRHIPLPECPSDPGNGRPCQHCGRCYPGDCARKVSLSTQDFPAGLINGRPPDHVLARFPGVSERGGIVRALAWAPVVSTISSLQLGRVSLKPRPGKSCNVTITAGGSAVPSTRRLAPNRLSVEPRSC